VSSTLTSLAGSAGPGSFRGEFDGADSFSGTWSLDRRGLSGTIAASRIGGASDPEARVTADFSGPVQGSVALDLGAGGEVTGVVLRANGRQLDTIASGTFSGGTLKATTNRGATLTGTVDPATGAFSGTWALGDASGDLNGASCQIDDSGGGSGTTPIDLGSENGPMVARSAGLGLVSLGGAGASLTQSQVIAADSGGTSTLSRSTTRATTTTRCQTGTATITENDGGTPDQLDRGDEWTAVWDACRFAPFPDFEFTLDGGVEYAVTQCTDCASAGDDSVAWAYEVDIAYDNWSIRLVQGATPTTDLAIDGAMTLGAVNDPGLNETTFELSGGPLSFTDRVENEAFGFESIGYTFVSNSSTGDYSVTVESTGFNDSSLGGGVTAETAAGEPLTGNSGQPPTDGTLVITGANGSQAIVDAGACGDNAFDLSVNGAGQGCVDWQTS